MKIISVVFICILTLAGCTTIKPELSPERKARSADIHYQIGIEALRKQQLPKAFLELRTALDLAPDRSDILDAMGLAWRMRGDLDKAGDYYERAMDNDPAPRTYNNYASLLLQKKQPGKAEKYLRQALKFPTYRNPDTAYINLGDALLAQGKFNEAIAAYRQASRLNNQQTFSRLKEAEAFNRYHRPEFALAVYETLLMERPGNRAAMEGMIALLVKSDRKYEAIKRLEHFRDITSLPMDRAWAQETIRSMKRGRK